MPRLQDKTVLVTGGSRGIGKAIALQLAREGANVAINYRSSSAEADAVAEQIRALGVQALVIQADVSKAEEARSLVEQVVDEWGRLDVLINNAGITRDRTLRKMTDEEWRAVIQTNLDSVFYTTSAAQRPMMEQNYGRIVNLSSYVAQAGAFGQANYAASKGGIISFTKTAALEFARYGITINALCPGYIETEMVAAIPAEVREKLLAKVPLGRFGKPEEVAKLVAFLVSEGDYITGQQININGGIYL